MTHLDPRIQIQATHLTNCVVQVTQAPRDLASALHINLGVRKHWKTLNKPNHYAAIITMQVEGLDATNAPVFVVEATIEQVSLIEGYSAAELARILAQTLPALALPYVRVQVANLLAHTGYHTITLPVAAIDDTNPATEYDEVDQRLIEEIAL